MIASLLMADPGQVGVLRFDPRSDDPEFLAKCKEALYADMSDEQVSQAMKHLHPDEPAQVLGVPSPVTKERFGSVARHFIRCTHDNAIPLAGQDEMIRMMDEAMHQETVVHDIESSHSPFHSQPGKLADIIARIAEA